MSGACSSTSSSSLDCPDSDRVSEPRQMIELCKLLHRIGWPWAGRAAGRFVRRAITITMT